MKKLVSIVLFVLMFGGADAATEKPIHEVVSDELTDETQISLQGAGDEHVVMCWWIPIEFWQSLFSRDTDLTAAEKKSMLKTLKEVSLLAVVQADIDSSGQFAFYSKEDVQKSLSIAFKDGSGKRSRVNPLVKVNPDLQVVLGVFKPILGSAMGNLGQNFHFFVLGDKGSADMRLLDPHQPGQLEFQLARKSGELMTGQIEMPLNSLYVPRKCPNGKDAHISWKFCPWTGKALD